MERADLVARRKETPGRASATDGGTELFAFNARRVRRDRPEAGQLQESYGAADGADAGRIDSTRRAAFSRSSGPLTTARITPSGEMKNWVGSA